MIGPVYIARCPVHGLHGARDECFVCEGQVEQVPMVLAGDLVDEIARSDAAEATLARVRNALAALDGHTCHEGHTDAEHLAMHRAVVGEVRAALEGAS